MKKIIMKVGLIIMSIITMITMNACSKINKETANDVCDALSKKYGESFVAVKIGDRFNTDSAKLYLHPENDDTLLFSAKIDRTSKEVTDNYIREIIANKIKKRITSQLTCSKESCEFRVVLMCEETSSETNEDITLDEFVEKYSMSEIVVYVPIISTAVSEEVIHDIVSSFKEIGDSVNINVSAILYNISESCFDDCIEGMLSYCDITSTWFESFELKGKASVLIKDNTVVTSIDKVIEELSGE